MLLYLLRHGSAEMQTSTGLDQDRALTQRGMTQVRSVIEQCRHYGLAPTAILTSNYTRAQQTATIAAEVLQYQDPVQGSLALAPEASPGQLWDEVRIYWEEPSLLLVTHQPLISESAQWLTAYAQDPGLDPPNFTPATIACFHIDPTHTMPGGTLLWSLNP